MVLGYALEHWQNDLSFYLLVDVRWPKFMLLYQALILFCCSNDLDDFCIEAVVQARVLLLLSVQAFY